MANKMAMSLEDVLAVNNGMKKTLQSLKQLIDETVDNELPYLLTQHVLVRMLNHGHFTLYSLISALKSKASIDYLFKSMNLNVDNEVDFYEEAIRTALLSQVTKTCQLVIEAYILGQINNESLQIEGDKELIIDAVKYVNLICAVEAYDSESERPEITIMLNTKLSVIL